MMGGSSFDFSQLKELKQNLEKMERERDQFAVHCTEELSALFLKKVKERTPVKSGNLKKNWSKGEIRISGGKYETEIKNPTEYAAPVEYGHRTADHGGWVPGKFMMTLTEKEVEKLAPELLKKLLDDYMKGELDV